jgi:hypothetical protein
MTEGSGQDLGHIVAGHWLPPTFWSALDQWNVFQPMTKDIATPGARSAPSAGKDAPNSEAVDLGATRAPAARVADAAHCPEIQCQSGPVAGSAFGERTFGAAWGYR